MTEVGGATTTRVGNPFPGLRPFEEKDQYLFFGRESQVDTMIDKLAETHFLAVVGGSGSGKSSLVNCGLKPALRRGLMSSAGSTWRMAYMRPGNDPIKALAQALVQPDSPDDPQDKDKASDRLFRESSVGGIAVKDIVEATLRASKMGLVDTLAQANLPPHTNLLVIADQFEELFRYRNLQSSSEGAQGLEEKSVAFVNLLLQAASAHGRIYVVMTMRSDFLGDCAQFFGLPEAINRGQYLVPRMSRDERRSAIEGPVKVAGAEITPVLLTRLVNDVGDNPDQLSILQHALNRTWAYWQNEGHCVGPVDLPHYVAIGTMTEALDRHADKAYNELGNDQQKAICKKVFQAITDKGTDARGIRRPTRAGTLCAIADVSIDDLTGVLSVFRKPSRSFVMPPESKSKTITPETVIDISHESLMRVWKRLGIWVDQEAESSAQYKRLVENAERYQQKKSKLMTGPELLLMRKWYQERQPTRAWAEQYKKDGFDSAVDFLHKSRKAQLTKRVVLVLGAVVVLAAGFGFYHHNELSKKKLAIAEVEKANSDAAAKKADDVAANERRLKDEALDAKQEALHQKELALAADKLAELERQKVMDALNAQAAYQTAFKEQQEKKGILDRDQKEHRSQDVIKGDKAEADAAEEHADKLNLVAAQKAAEAVALVSNTKLITPSQISSSDLFDVAQGTKVTGFSGSTSSADIPEGASDMFRGSRPSKGGATIFPDGQPVGTGSFIEWRTKEPVTLRSVGLFAAHDLIRLRRSFRVFKLYVKKAGEWSPVVEYTPGLSPDVWYGGSCDPRNCVKPDGKYNPGTVLAVCINVKPTTGQEFRAVFVQTATFLDDASGPRVLQLDGYSHSDCAK